jgi:retinol dehydrogenase 12
MTRNQDQTMAGKVVAITGANSGIGRATAQALAGMGATVLACGRSQAKLDAAVAAIREATGNAEVHALVADLSVMAEVRGLAKQIRDRTDRLDVLINNAGIGSDRRIETPDGFELTFAVNHFAPFVLTTELLPLLEASAPSRVVTVSSGMYATVKALDLEDLQTARGKYAWQDVYACSKLANVLFTRELARRLEGKGVTATCLHPGVIDTGFGADGDLRGFNALAFRVMKWFLPGPDAGARTSVFLASSPDVEGVTGRYFAKCRDKPMSPLAQDDTLAKALWTRSEALVGG